MDLFFIRTMDIANLNKQTVVAPAISYFGNIKEGDFAFVKYLDNSNGITERLWKVDKILNTNAGVEVKFVPLIPDGSFKIYQNQFGALKFINFNVESGRLISAPTRSKICHRLSYTIPAGYSTLQDFFNDDFGDYCSDTNNYRKIYLYPDKTAAVTDTQNEDFQLYLINPNEYGLIDSTFIDMRMKDQFCGTNVFIYESLTNSRLCNAAQRLTDLANSPISFGNGMSVSSVYAIFFQNDADKLSKELSKALKKASNPGTESVSDSEDSSDETHSEEQDDDVSSTKDSGGYTWPSLWVGINKCFYGTPGCGKSYHVREKELAPFNPNYVFRTTFHQEYTNTDFVGQILPIRTPTGVIDYKFIPGPFTIALECAFSHPEDQVALVIEELNRGEAASIFGDLFQLLDRLDDMDSSGHPKGTSEYGIHNIPILNYLNGTERYQKGWNIPCKFSEVRIPANLFIFATMNVGDQNVKTLDTAFKRRWESEKISNNFNSEDASIRGLLVPGLNGVTWERFVTTINQYMISNSSFLSEDRQIGKHFVKEKLLLDGSETPSEINQKTKDFAYKVLEYLWNDVAKLDRKSWFDVSINSFDDLVDRYCSSTPVFSSSIKF